MCDRERVYISASVCVCVHVCACVHINELYACVCCEFVYIYVNE